MLCNVKVLSLVFPHAKSSFPGACSLKSRPGLVILAKSYRICKADEEFSPTGLLKVAGVIGAATATSKVLGLGRELALASVFGVGPVVDAFGYASIIPGFFLAVLGGINGPIHVTLVTSLSKLSEEQGKELVDKLYFSMLLVSVSFSLLVCIFASKLLDAYAPGLLSGPASNLLTRNLAVLQLRIMSPCIMLACLMGIGYGRLSALGKHGLASSSPVISSLSVILTASLYSLFSSRGGDSRSFIIGGVSLALASTAGALAQWFLQISVQGAPLVPALRLENPFQHEDVKKFLLLLVPAAVSSGMLQLATYTDLYFASYFPQAAASLGYANLLVMAPLGILSSSVLIPMLPVFSRLSEPQRWPELRSRVRQGMEICIALTLPMTAILVPLARPVVRVLFQRYAFDEAAAEAVSLLVIHYTLGSTFYLARDFLVRVFYSLGDTRAPFYVSMAAIVANAAFDWLLIHKAGFGPEGLVLATSIVNVMSVVALWQMLSAKLEGLESHGWLRSLVFLLGCAVVTLHTTAASYKWFQLLGLRNQNSWTKELAIVVTSGLSGFVSFGVLLGVGWWKRHHQSKI